MLEFMKVSSLRQNMNDLQLTMQQRSVTHD